MKTVNSLSGGQTSSYIAKQYPADYNVFALVRTDDKNCLWLNGKDEKTRQLVSDKIGTEFIGTLEDDKIIYTMLDLEQFIGKKIDWLSEKTFESVLTYGDDKTRLPNVFARICTKSLKIEPIAQYCYDNIGETVEMRIGFRANELRRVENMQKYLEKDGFQYTKVKVGKHKNGNNKWKTIKYRKPVYPLIKDIIFKDTIVNYWKDKPVRFGYMNNCIGCFHRNELLLKHMSTKFPKKFAWFINQEKNSMKNSINNTWKQNTTYEKIKSHKTQLQLFDDDFNDCDSGYCGL